jgi:hypothetical protein
MQNPQAGVPAQQEHRDTQNHCHRNADSQTITSFPDLAGKGLSGTGYSESGSLKARRALRRDQRARRAHLAHGSPPSLASAWHGHSGPGRQPSGRDRITGITFLIGPGQNLLSIPGTGQHYVPGYHRHRERSSWRAPRHLLSRVLRGARHMFLRAIKPARCDLPRQANFQGLPAAGPSQPAQQPSRTARPGGAGTSKGGAGESAAGPGRHAEGWPGTGTASFWGLPDAGRAISGSNLPVTAIVKVR